MLHYRANNAPLRDGDLLLIDAGAEYECYASDVTRTFPVNGRFSPEQRALYDIVLAAQAAAIDEVRPGRSFDAYHEAAVRTITRGLIKLGLLEGSLEKNLREHAYRKFYMHKTGHWLGLDVHDVGDYRIDGEFRQLEPGMVVTVEPGIYIAPDLKKRSGALARHRHPHRGRRRRHARRSGDPDQRRAARSRRDRSADGGSGAMSLVHVLLTALAWLGANAFASVHAPAARAFRVEEASPNVASAPAPAGSKPSTELLDYGLFGTLHLSRPTGDALRTVLFFSDRDGWNERQDRLAGALAGEGAFVVGIDLPTYLKKLAGLSSKCAYPAGHVEEVAHWIERHEGFATYTYPLVVGDGSGATFAYALVAQAPAGTFAGLVTLGWDGALRFSKEICAGDAGAVTAPDEGAFRVVPVARLPATWIPKPFAAGARATGLLADARVAFDATGALLRPLAPLEARADLAATFARWRRNEDAARVALPDEIADLPITDIPPTKGDAHRIAIIITGDGGWAGLDRGVADALNADGVRVIGFSTLKFFWHKQTPDAAAEADRARHRALRPDLSRRDVSC